MFKERIQAEMRGRWDEYFLDRLDIDVTALKGVPCFKCQHDHGHGGDDRFTWTNLNGNGGYFCRGGGHGEHYTDGLGLAQELWQIHHGYTLSFVGVLEEVEDWLAGRPANPNAGRVAVSPVKAGATDKTARVLDKQDTSTGSVATHEYVMNKRLASAAVFRSADTGVFEGKINVPYSAYDDPFGPRIGVEQIEADGTKKTLAGTHKGINILGTPKPDSPWLVCEGWATGLALSQVLRDTFGLGAYNVAVCGGKGKLKTACEFLPNARPIFEDDGEGTPEGQLHFACNTHGNDIADHLGAGDTDAIQYFTDQLDPRNKETETWPQETLTPLAVC